MQKIFRRYIVIVMVLAGVVISIMNYCLLSVDIRQEETKRQRGRVAQIAQSVNSAESAAQQLKDSLDQEYIAVANGVAQILAEDKKILKDIGKADSLMEQMGILDINVVNEKGEITATTSDDYLGRNLGDYEQSKPFMEMISNGQESLVQDVMPDAISGEMTQYVAVKMMDQKGILLLRMDAEKQVQADEQSELSYIFGYMTVDEGEILFAVNKDTGEIMSHTLDDYNGQCLYDLGVNKKKLSEYEYGREMEMGEDTYFCVMKEYDGILIGTGITNDELYAQRGNKMVWIIVFLLVVFGVILYLVNELLKEKVINGINTLMDWLKKIERGHIEEKIKLTGNPEYEKLSASMNSMVSGLVRSTSRMSRIVEMADVPIGAYEYISSMNRVMVTEELGKILRLSEKDEAQYYTNRSMFVKYMRQLKQDPVPEEEDIYQISEDYFLKIVEVTEDGGTFGIVQDVSEDMTSKNQIRKERDYDPLTNIYNRRTFERLANKILGQPDTGVAAVIMLDLDKFKGVNDNYGHEFGDKYLIQMADYMRHVASDNVMVGRRSGDEFYMIAYGFSSRDEVNTMMKEFYDNVEANPVHYPDGRVAMMGVSAGLAWYDKGTFEGFEALLEKADQKLYDAKEGGRGKYEA